MVALNKQKSHKNIDIFYMCMFTFNKLYDSYFAYEY